MNKSVIINPRLDRDELEKLLGRKEARGLSAPVEAKVDRLEGIVSRVIRPRIRHQIIAVDLVRYGVVLLRDGPALVSQKLSKAMRHCREIVVFVATIGDGIEREIEHLMQQDRLSEGYILDAMGSVLVEDMVENYYERTKIRHQAEGRDVTLRFSPGYCDWPVTEQQKLFGLFDPDTLEVELTGSCLMSPRKSVSGLFGILPPETHFPVIAYNPCHECGKRDCPGRRN